MDIFHFCCSLVSKTLLYYKSEQDTTMHPRGRIDLGKSVTVEVRSAGGVLSLRSETCPRAVAAVAVVVAVVVVVGFHLRAG